MSKEIILSAEAPAPIGPYSQAVAHNGVLYVSGQIALHPLTSLMVQDDIETETGQVLDNLFAILDKAGCTAESVLKCTIFVKDMGNFALINKVYSEYFTQRPPARETVEVSRLPKDANVEISCIAAV